jgi:hypothetical protein
MPNFEASAQNLVADLHAALPAHLMIVESDPDLDDQLHEALMQSFDCGDPVALSFT